MPGILRIVDRWKIADVGTLYTVNKMNGAEIRIGDSYEDLRCNRFRVKGIEAVHSLDGKIHKDAPTGILLELVDGVEVCGNILISEQQNINFLFCNHPLYPKRADEDYEEEYRAARHGHPCELFSYEDLQMGSLSLYGEDISGLTIYRGWMMKPELYRKFYDMLEARNIILINTPEEYGRYHMLPGWYEDFKDDTVRSVWEEEGSLENALEIARKLEGAYIVKDYVKSRKHEWYDACFIPNIADRENASRVIGNFITRQGSDLVGGVVLRKYEKFKNIGFHEKSGMPISEEYRVFIFAGRIMIADDYWREGVKVSFSDSERKWMEEMASRVRSNFVTMDIARKEDGSLVVMEFGDGRYQESSKLNRRIFIQGFEKKICKKFHSRSY